MSAAITIPDPPAEPQRLRENAARLRTTAERYEFLVTRALFAWSLLPEGYRAPEADILHAALATTHPAAEEIADGLAAAPSSPTDGMPVRRRISGTRASADRRRS